MTKEHRMNFVKRSVVVKNRRSLIVLFVVLAVGTFSYRVLRSGVPDDNSLTPDSPAVPYIGELMQAGVSVSFPAGGLPAPDNRWKFVLDRENSRERISGFYSAKLLDIGSGQKRVLFTLWDADVGSGCKLGVRWSSDSKALRLAGQTRGFNYWIRKDEPFDFDFIYMVDIDKMFRLPDGN